MQDALEERNKLIEENVNLVGYVANRYFSDVKDIEELIGIGNIGLIKAADDYDKHKNIKFSTFACTCIYHEICRHFLLENYLKRRANKNALSLEEKRYIDNEEITFKDRLVDRKDNYSDAERNILLDLIDTFDIKNARFIIIKRSEGYTYQEIAEVIGVSKEAVRQTIVRIKKRLIRLGIHA